MGGILFPSEGGDAWVFRGTSRGPNCIEYRVGKIFYAVPETEGRILHAVPLLEGLPVKSFPLILKRMLLFPSEVRVAWVFLGISLGLRPREIPRKTQATPPSDGKSIPFL